MKEISPLLRLALLFSAGAICAQPSDTTQRVSWTPDPMPQGERSPQPNASRIFRDPKYGYSILYPSTWIRKPLISAPGPAVTLYLVTPLRNQFVVSLYPLPTRLMRFSSAKFDEVGHDHVDRVLSIYRGILNLDKIVRQQPENQSTEEAMIFWQGTSAFDKSLKPWALVSTHVIRYGSDLMINMIFLGSNQVEKEGKSMDAVMRSLSFER